MHSLTIQFWEQIQDCMEIQQETWPEIYIQYSLHSTWVLSDNFVEKLKDKLFTSILILIGTTKIQCAYFTYTDTQFP
jgi:hypothetical protein